jgi:hypothetical protein
LCRPGSDESLPRVTQACACHDGERHRADGSDSPAVQRTGG